MAGLVSALLLVSALAVAACGMSLRAEREGIRAQLAQHRATAAAGEAPTRPQPIDRSWLRRTGAGRRTQRPGRRAAATQGLVEACAEIAAGMRSGGSIVHGLERAASRAEPEHATDLRGVLGATSSGTSLDSALGAWAARSDDPDVRLTAAVIQMHRRTGGDLPHMLDRVAETLRDRLAAAREVTSLTAQAKLSGIVVGVLPIGFFAFLTLLSPGEMAGVVASPMGAVLIAIGLALEGLAYLWIRQILRSE